MFGYEEIYSAVVTNWVTLIFIYMYVRHDYHIHTYKFLSKASRINLTRIKLTE